MLLGFPCGGTMPVGGTVIPSFLATGMPNISGKGAC